MAYLGLNFIEKRHSDITTPTDPKKSDLAQPNRVVLITGAGRGIGRSTALRFAECGVASIILCARTLSQLDEVEGAIKSINSKIRVYKFEVDVSNEQTVAKVAESIKDSEGRISVLINNAGASDEWHRIHESNDDYWRCWEVNYKGPYLMTKHFVTMIESGGTIVNVSSIGAEIVHPSASAYQVSKMALNRFTEFTQAEYPDITCVAIHPGGVLTELSKGIESIRPNLVDTPELGAGCMVWLAHGDKSWLGGRFIYANWDVEELVKRRDDIVQRDLLKMRLAI